MGCVREAPPSVVGMGVALVDGMEALWVAPLEELGGLDGLEALWVAPSEVLGGLYFVAAWLDAQSYGCALGVGWGLVVVRRLQQICWLVAGWHPWSGRQSGQSVRPVQGLQGRQLGAWLNLCLRWLIT